MLFLRVNLFQRDQRKYEIQCRLFYLLRSKTGNKSLLIISLLVVALAKKSPVISFRFKKKLSCALEFGKRKKKKKILAELQQKEESREKTGRSGET